MNTYGTVVIFFFFILCVFFLFNLIDYTVTCNSLEWEKMNKFFFFFVFCEEGKQIATFMTVCARKIIMFVFKKHTFKVRSHEEKAKKKQRKEDKQLLQVGWDRIPYIHISYVTINWAIHFYPNILIEISYFRYRKQW